MNELNLDNQTQEAPGLSEEQLFEQEFNKAAEALYEKSRGKYVPQQEQDVSDIPEVKEPQTQLPTDQEEKEDPDQSDEEATEVKEPKTDSTYDNLRKEIEEMRAKYENQLSMANGRLRNVANQYQQLKKQVNTSSNKQDKEQTTPETTPISVFGTELPSLEDAKRILGNDKEYVSALMRVFEDRIENVKGSINNEVRNQVTPLYQHVRLSGAEQQRQAILKAHPDMQELVDSGEVLNWINSMTPIYKTGATRVYYSGNAEESIALLNEYKKQKGLSSNEHSNSETPSNGTSSKDKNSKVNKTSASSAQQEADRVARLKASLAVPSGKSEADLNPTPAKARSDEDEFEAAAEKLYASRNRYRLR